MSLVRALFFIFLTSAVYAAEINPPILVVAAENVYGKLAQQIGGEHVSVTNILQNPKQDPHLFSNNPSVSISFFNAKLIIYNGLDYDPWAKKIVESNRNHKVVIVVGDIMGRKEGDNPHIWYDPNTMPRLAEVIGQKLAELDPVHANYFTRQVAHFKNEYTKLWSIIEEMRRKYSGTPITATEPLFNDMAKALGLKMLGLGFQVSVMNDTPPSIAEVKEINSLLDHKKVYALIYNKQVFSEFSEKLRQSAEKQGIPTVAMSEMQPPSQSYIEWMSRQLIDLDQALASKHAINSI